jgi:hypothetical protein
MALKTKTGYACGYCKKEFTGKTAMAEADECKDSHNLIYVQISKEDLQKLIMFIYSKEDRVLPETLVERLQSYLKTAFDFSLVKEKK